MIIITYERSVKAASHMKRTVPVVNAENMGTNTARRHYYEKVTRNVNYHVSALFTTIRVPRQQCEANPSVTHHSLDAYLSNNYRKRQQNTRCSRYHSLIVHSVLYLHRRVRAFDSRYRFKQHTLNNKMRTIQDETNTTKISIPVYYQL